MAVKGLMYQHDYITTGFEAEVFTGQMLFLSPNQPTASKVKVKAGNVIQHSLHGSISSPEALLKSWK